MEKTFVMIKPDSVKRGLIGKIISRFEQRNIRVRAIKMMNVSEELAAKHYEEHVGKPFYGELLAFVTSGPVVAMVLEGNSIVPTVRAMMGKTNSAEAASGTIRGDFSISHQQNIIHGSDSPVSAEREISNFFTDEELVDW